MVDAGALLDLLSAPLRVAARPGSAGAFDLLSAPLRVAARPGRAGAFDLPSHELRAAAAAIRDRAWGRTITYSPKVFVALTNLCRDRCGYCTYRRDPDDPAAYTMSPDDVAALLDRAARAGCSEALICLGDRPEATDARYRALLAGWGFASTAEYVEHACRAALARGLLPHTNAGILLRAELARLKPVNASLGLMLETASERLRGPGMAHEHAPTKAPRARLKMLRTAGELAIAMTTGILVGIGESRQERVAALAAIRALHERYGHIQECIVQPFHPKPGIAMQHVPAADPDELLDAVALARLILPPDVAVQAPPNLVDDLGAVLAAGINDWGGISPITADFINPERRWPHIDRLAQLCAAHGFVLAPRPPVYPRFLADPVFTAPAVAALAGRA